jgi:hypothetical protein
MGDRRSPRRIGRYVTYRRWRLPRRVMLCRHDPVAKTRRRPENRGQNHSMRLLSVVKDDLARQGDLALAGISRRCHGCAAPLPRSCRQWFAHSLGWVSAWSWVQDMLNASNQPKEAVQTVAHPSPGGTPVKIDEKFHGETCAFRPHFSLSPRRHWWLIGRFRRRGGHRHPAKRVMRVGTLPMKEPGEVVVPI